MDVGVFPQRLAAARAAAGLTKSQMVVALRLRSRSIATKWEAGLGMPDPPTLRRMAVTLNTTTDYLLGVDTLRDTPPAVTVDMAEAAAAPRVTWRGTPISADARARVWPLLRALLAPIDQLREISDYPQDVHKAPPPSDANTVADRAKRVSIVRVRRPTRKGRGRGGAPGGPVDGGDQ